MDRRSFAPLIRARQEARKGLERWSSIPRWRGADDTLAVLAPGLARAARRDSRQALRVVADTFRANATTRYPRVHLATRDQSSLPDAADIIADGERLVRGDWDALGARVRVSADTVEWRTHPVSLVRTPALHFSRVSYGTDVLGGDVKFLWELNRHAELLRLAQAYWLTRRPEFARVAIALLESWIDQNPPGIGINWISVVDVALRTMAWCWVWALTADCDAWTDERIGRLLWSVGRAGRFIAQYDSVHHSPNTHLTGEALGLIYIATVFPELREADSWRSFGTRILREEVPHQFLADGMHYERCTGYHRYHLEFYLHALAIARAGGESWADGFCDWVGRGAEASAQLRRPNGTWPVFGDEDGGSTLRLGTRDVADQSELLVVAASLLDRSDLRAGIDRKATSLAWWTLDDEAWARTGALRTDDHRFVPSASLRASGYYTARDDWSVSAWYCAVDAGPHGGEATGHAHTDLGHVEIAHGRQLITVDPGCPVYTGEPKRRNWFRSQHAHAGVTIDGSELAVPSTPFGWARVAPTPAAEAEDRESHWVCRLWYAYPTPRGDVLHERQVVLVRSQGVVVCDLLRGGGPRTVTVRWPLGASRDSVCLDASASRLTIGDSRVRWHQSDGGTVTAAVEATRRSPRFGVEADASALVLTAINAQLPLAIAAAFTARSDPDVAMRQAEHGMDVMLPGAAEVGALTISFRAGALPRVVDADRAP